MPIHDVGQAPSSTSPGARANPIGATPSLAPDVSATKPIGHHDEATPFLPTDSGTPSAEDRPLERRVPVVKAEPPPNTGAIAGAGPELPFAEATGNNAASNPPSTSPNLEAVQEARPMANSADTGSGGTSPLPEVIENLPTSVSGSDSLIPSRPNPPSTLRPELKREVEMIVRKQEDELRRKQQSTGQPAPPLRDTIVSDLRAQTQLDISRAPSPAEARPIKAIPVPEDWVPLPPRTWVAQRKYWAAAATCHLPLYFQDPVLERYGHSVEQFLGPVGRCFTYPLDDPTQSTQRNQILQPFFSAGLFALQIAALPYNVIMDPPWEAQYDLGYYRPGDNIPTDTYWLPLHGYGPPLRGSNY